MVQWYCLPVLDFLFDSSVYLDCPSDSFTHVMNQEHGPNLHVLDTEINLLFIIMDTSWIYILNYHSVYTYWMLRNLVSNKDNTYLIVAQHSHLCQIPQVKVPVDAFFLGVLNSEPCSSHLLCGECSSFNGFHKYKTEALVDLTTYMFTNLLPCYIHVTNTNCICPRYTGEATRHLSGPS